MFNKAVANRVKIVRVYKVTKDISIGDELTLNMIQTIYKISKATIKEE